MTIRPSRLGINRGRDGGRVSCHNNRSFVSDDDDLKYKHPFSCMVSGNRKSENTSFCIRLLQILAALCTEREFSGGIIWCYSEKTNVPKRRLLPSNTTYHEGVPDNFGGGGGG